MEETIVIVTTRSISCFTLIEAQVYNSDDRQLINLSKISFRLGNYGHPLIHKSSYLL